MLRKKIIIDFDSERLVVSENNSIISFIPSAVIRKKNENPVALYFGMDALKKKSRLKENELFCVPFSNGKIIDVIGAKALFRAVFKNLFGSNKFLSIYIIINGNLEENDKNIISRIFISLGYNKINLIPRPKLIAKLLEYNSLPIAVYCDSDITELILDSHPVQSYSIDVSQKALAENLRTKFLSDNKIKLSIDTSLKLAKEYCSLFQHDMTKITIDGKDSITLARKSVYLTAKDIYPLVSSVYSNITDLIAAVMMDSSSELSTRIVNIGILFLGSGTKIQGFEEFIYEKLHLKSIIDDNDTLLINLAYNLVSKIEEDISE